MPEVATNSNNITKENLPPFYGQLYINGSDAKVYFNINNSICSVNCNYIDNTVLPLTNVNIVSGVVNGVTISATTITGTIITATTNFYAGAGSVSAPSIRINGATSGLYSIQAGEIDVALASTQYLAITGAGIFPMQASMNLGDGTNYWGDVSYKTLTDRGCLGWFDEGVELQDGRKVGDIEAIETIQKHPTKKTVYGTPMLDYKTFPKVAYKPADKDGKLLPRDTNDEPYWINEKGEKKQASDGIEMTSLFSIMIGAIKELSNQIKELKSLKK